MSGPACVRCGKRLRPMYAVTYERVETPNAAGGVDVATVTTRTARVTGYGYLGHGHFCTQSCGYLWAVTKIRQRR